MINTPCLLCGTVAKLVKSHIIPQFMYDGMFHNRKIGLMPISEGERGYFLQSGIFDKGILCEKCDSGLIGGFERYVANFLYAKETGALQNTETKTSNGGPYLHVTGLDYQKFKLFILSILWRANVSKNPFFNGISTPGIEKELREMILSQDAGPEGQFRINVMAIKDFEGGYVNMIPAPNILHNEQLEIAQFFINGFLFLIELKLHPESTIFGEHSLKASGEISIPILTGTPARKMLKFAGVTDEVIERFTNQEYPRFDKIDLKEQLIGRFPAIFSIISEDEPFRWTNLNNKFIEVHNQRVDQFIRNGGRLQVEANFYDLIVQAIKDEPAALNLLDVVSSVFGSLSSQLTQEGRRLIKSTLYSFLISFDNKYLNFFGELMVLDTLLKSGDYKLIATAFPMANGKDIDFKLQNIRTGKPILVEVLNIHLTIPVESTDEDIHRFFEKRVTDKYSDKTKNGSAEIPFIIVPVVWGNGKELVTISNYLKINPLNVPNVIGPVAWCSLSDGRNYVENRFGMLITLFDGLQLEP